MNRKLIEKILSRKINHWLKSITDETLREFLADKIIVTGGCIASMLLGEDINDFDIYFRTKEATARVARYYVSIFQATHKENAPAMTVVSDNPSDPDRVKIYIGSAGAADESSKLEFNDSDLGIPDDEKDEFDNALKTDDQLLDSLFKKKESKPAAPAKVYKPKFITSNAITLSDKIQCIIRFYGEPDKIHENYDFIHCCNYWTSWERTLTLRPAALESLITKELKYVGSKYPICSIIRTRKFIRRGWFISAGQYLKILNQISGMDLKDIKVLDDQLIGVDSSYFRAMIDKMKTDAAEIPGHTIDDNYLVELIDKIF